MMGMLYFDATFLLVRQFGKLTYANTEDPPTPPLCRGCYGFMPKTQKNIQLNATTVLKRCCVRRQKIRPCSGTTPVKFFPHERCYGVNDH
eukprot:m.1197381 g.1197381  ORF g.1197381 m.1197381 type:complete len:90 (-) comp24567_c0_seq1:1452-1721(-)